MKASIPLTLLLISSVSSLLPPSHPLTTRLLTTRLHRGLGSQELLFLPRPYPTTFLTPGASTTPDPERATIHAVCVEVSLEKENFEGWIERCVEANPILSCKVASTGREESTKR